MEGSEETHVAEEGETEVEVEAVEGLAEKAETEDEAVEALVEEGEAGAEVPNNFSEAAQHFFDLYTSTITRSGSAEFLPTPQIFWP